MADLHGELSKLIRTVENAVRVQLDFRGFFFSSAGGCSECFRMAAYFRLVADSERPKCNISIKVRRRAPHLYSERERERAAAGEKLFDDILPEEREAASGADLWVR